MLRGIAAVFQTLLFIGALQDGAGVARADNPIVQTIYTADPAPLVYDGRVYLFTGHDEDGSTTYTMRDWRLFSSVYGELAGPRLAHESVYLQLGQR